MARMVLRSISFFNKDISCFAPGTLDDALSYLKVESIDLRKK